MPSVAVVGIGDWGKNLLRVFDDLANVKYCCHTGSPSNREWHTSEYPNINLTTNYSQILDDKAVDAVVIATPVHTHFDLAQKVQKSNKYVFVEKPLTATAKQAEELSHANIFTGYIFCYAPAIQKLQNLVSDDPVQHISASWKKFGSFKSPIVQNLVSHDISIGHFLFDEQFTSGSITEDIGIRTDSDILTTTLETESGRTLCGRYNRVANTKEKRITVTTESDKQFLFLNDELFVLRGDHYLKISENTVEPLQAECSVFLGWIDGDKTPITAGRFGVDVSQSLELLNTG